MNRNVANTKDRFIISNNPKYEADLKKNRLPVGRRESENPLTMLRKSKNPATFFAKSDDPRIPVLHFNFSSQNHFPQAKHTGNLQETSCVLKLINFVM